MSEAHEAQLRQWVENNPGHVDQGCGVSTPLEIAVLKNWLSLVMRLLDVKGADVNTTSIFGKTPLQCASSAPILTALIPSLPNNDGKTPLITHTDRGRVDLVACLLQYPRVQATINFQEPSTLYTALHRTSLNYSPKSIITIFRLLLQAGAMPGLTSTREDTALDLLREVDPTQIHAIALLQEYPAAKKDADKASLLVKGRRLVAVSRSRVPPSYLRSRVLHGLPFPYVALMPARSNEIEEKDRSMLAFLLGMGGGPDNTGMPRDVFRVVLDFPTWDPLRREKTGVGRKGVCAQCMIL